MLQRGPGWIEGWPQPVVHEDEGDDGLARRIHRGDAEAESEFAERFYPRVLVVLIARTHDRDAAHDLAQEVMISALGAVRAGQVHDLANLAGFVHGIARNVANEHFRSVKRNSRNVPLTADVIAADVPDQVEARGMGQFIRRALRRLEPVDRRILHMVFGLEMSAVEIAPVLGLTSETVRQRKSRALRKVTTFVRDCHKRGGLPTTCSATPPMIDCDDAARDDLAER